ncbi:transposase [Streptosporangium canum]|uniref:transposase n=1 Tax=Streptosporangium canum TaxID=324952 RepID=UPI0036BA7D6D
MSFHERESVGVARPSKYGDEFKKDAVRLVRESHRTCADVARELGMNRETLRVRVREAEQAESDTDTGAGPARSEREELARLRKRVAEPVRSTGGGAGTSPICRSVTRGCISRR